MALAAMLLACGDEPEGREETGLEALGLTDVSPKLVLPGTRLQLTGRSFLDQPLGVSWLRLEGSYEGVLVDTYLPADFIDYERMEIVATSQLLRLGVGTFSGRAQVEVDFVPDGSHHSSVPLALTLEIADHLAPVLDDVVATSTIRVNEPVEVTGSGLLLGGDEGTTFAVVEGCFAAMGSDQCVAVAPVKVPVSPAEPFVRERGMFAFVPEIAGIRAGSFAGTVLLRNEHADGMVAESSARPIAYNLAETIVDRVGDDEPARFGRFVEITGGGFVRSGNGGGTVLRFVGEYQADAGDAVPLDFEVVPEFVDGRTVRYVINESDDLASAIAVREAQGTFVGTVQPRVDYGGDHVEGVPTPASLRLEPVRQVVYLKWMPTYVEALRPFGLRTLDDQIRERVRQVLVRDYAGVNIEFRDEPPEDYALYATIEISGPDPNGLGLLGYDNTHGKDDGNVRLDDKIGGVNAQTLESGLPGFGGVFLLSLFGFSQHPPANTVESSQVATASFDRIFDPFRPDRGQPVVSAELLGGTVSILPSGDLCPANDRPTQMACAVFVLGSVVGSTTSHELGHSLGLANPYRPDPHAAGDEDDRLMDAGGARTFEERAEIYYQGPSKFCVDEYAYLREILPSNEPAPEIERPPC